MQWFTDRVVHFQEESNVKLPFKVFLKLQMYILHIVKEESKLIHFSVKFFYCNIDARISTKLIGVAILSH
jgi:hypothetical protein